MMLRDYFQWLRDWTGWGESDEPDDSWADLLLIGYLRKAVWSPYKLSDSLLTIRSFIKKGPMMILCQINFGPLPTTGRNYLCPYVV